MTIVTTNELAHTQNSPYLKFALLITFIFAIGLWVFQSLVIPYWQDDYFFLLQAENARLDAESWWVAFSNERSETFWRPLGVDFYWRLLDSILAGNVVAAHLFNLVLHLLSAISVAWFSASLVKLIQPKLDTRPVFLLTTLLYGIHAANFLPVVWASAANSSLAVIASALSLGFWIKALSVTDHKEEIGSLLAALVLYVIALFCREIAIVIPVLGALIYVLTWPELKPSRLVLLSGLLSVIVAIIWLLLRTEMVVQSDEAYGFNFGSNIFRNAASLLLFFFNVPREGLRFILTEPSLAVIGWISACFLFQFAAVVFFVRAAWKFLQRQILFFLCLFAVIGCAPYFILNENSYAYYIAIALFAYAVVITLGLERQDLLARGLILAVISSLLSWTGNYFLEYPSLLGRAMWVEDQMQLLEIRCVEEPTLCQQPINLDIQNEHKFLGFGYAGLAYRTGLITPEQPDDELPRLVIPDEGDVYFLTE